MQASACEEQAVALYRQLDDRRWLASVMLLGTRTLESSGKLAEAESVLKETLVVAQSDGNALVTIWLLITLARVTARLYGDTQAAWNLTEEALRLAIDAELDGQVADVYEVRGVLAVSSGQYEEARLWFEKAMLMYQSVDADFNVLLIKSNLAHLERQFGHNQQALERYRETIMGFHNIGQLGAVTHQLECFGFLAMAGDREERALMLFAAADALRKKVGAPMTSEEGAYFDEQMNVLRQNMDAGQFKRIWNSGRALTMEQALEFALEKNTG
jgi:tetratricopeptide (TPR) repeat protein